MTAPLRPPGTDERSVRTPHGVLRVLHSGPGSSERPPILLIHGGSSDNAAISWYRLFAPLGEEYPVWAVDLPGFGGSIDVPPAGGPRELADCVGGAMAALDLEPAVVFGVSMGGDVALNLALAHPQRVRGLVLVAPGGLVPRLRSRAVQFGAWALASLPDWILLPATRLANRFVGSALRAIVADPSTLPPEVVTEFAREARHPRAGLGFGRYNQATIERTRMNNDLSGAVHRIGVPALLFHGAADPMVDPEGSRRAARQMPHARLVLVPDCGHWAQLEAHDRFLAEVRPFLDGAVGAGPERGGR